MTNAAPQFRHGEAPLLCTSCGAPLAAAPQTGIAVCEHCGSRVTRPAAAPERSVSLEDDIEQVEQWWRRERQPLMTRDRRGNLHPPEEKNIALTVLMSLGMVLGLGSAVGGHAWGSQFAGIAGFFLFPILITLPSALLHERAERRYKAYEKLAAAYQGRRNAIIDRHARRS